MSPKTHLGTWKVTDLQEPLWLISVIRRTSLYYYQNFMSAKDSAMKRFQCIIKDMFIRTWHCFILQFAATFSLVILGEISRRLSIIAVGYKALFAFSVSDIFQRSCRLCSRSTYKGTKDQTVTAESIWGMFLDLIIVCHVRFLC